MKSLEVTEAALITKERYIMVGTTLLTGFNALIGADINAEKTTTEREKSIEGLYLG